jgi:hypothetical protein
MSAEWAVFAAVVVLGVCLVERLNAIAEHLLRIRNEVRMLRMGKTD